MRITSKGQVTIPVAVRERLGLLPDTEVEFAVRGQAALIRKAARPSRRWRRIVATMRGRATTGLGTDAILRLTRRG